MQATETLPPVLLNGNPFQCAVLLDEDGREIPITEEMIAKACDELMKQWHFPRPAA